MKFNEEENMINTITYYSMLLNSYYELLELRDKNKNLIVGDMMLQNQKYIKKCVETLTEHLVWSDIGKRHHKKGSK